MFRFLLIGAGSMVFAIAASAKPADGELVSSKPCVLHPISYDENVAAIRKAYEGEVALAAKAGIAEPPASDLLAVAPTRAEYAALTHIYGCRSVFYGSDGLKVAAYIWEPTHIRAGTRLPVVVALRGGNRDFGKFTPEARGGWRP